MNKKKAIKLVTASALAASSFAAVAPFNTEAAVSVSSSVNTAVSQASKAYHVYYDASFRGQAASVASVQSAVVAAQKSYNSAKTLVNKNGGKQKTAYLGKLDAALKNIKLAQNYITAVNYVNGLNKTAVKLDTTTRNNGFTSVKGEFSTFYSDLGKADAKVRSLVAGKTAADVVIKTFLTYPKNVATLVNGYSYADSATYWMNKDDFKTAQARLDSASAYFKKGPTASNLGKAVSTYIAKVNADFEAMQTPKVVGVSAINATQVEVKFNKAVDPASLFTNGTDGVFKATVTLNSIESTFVPAGNLSGELSEDGKTLTITSTYALSKRYNLVVSGVLTTNSDAVAKYDDIVNIAADTIAPQILSTTQTSASTFKVTFSEPVKTLGTVSYKFADGSVATSVTNNFTQGDTEVIFTLGSAIDAGKQVTVTFVGAQDQAGNLLTPNPATVSFVKDAKDGVAPTLSSVIQTGADTFTVKFSEQLVANPTVSIGGIPVAAANVVKDTTDPTVYKVTAPAVLDGASTVTVSNFTDLSGEVGTTTGKVVLFVKDTVAPKVVSSNVVADPTTKKEYLEFTFDKDVNLVTPTVNVTSGSYTKDYVTTSLLSSDFTATTITYKSVTDKKVVRVSLSDLLGTKNVTGANYSLNLAFSGVKSLPGAVPASITAAFTRGQDGVAANTDVVAVNSIAQGADNNKVAVTFNGAVDGASGTTAANYQVGGAVVDSVTLLPVSGTTQVAILNLKANSNTFTGVRNVTVSNVKALGSTKIMTTTTKQVNLKENVVATVTSAKLTDINKITLTFSEDVLQAVTTANDFELLVDGKSIATPVLLDSALTDKGATTVTITLSTPVTATQIASGLSLKAVSTLDVVDAAGNLLSVPANIIVGN